MGDIVAKRYRVTGIIGTGGMGTVYDARDLQTGREVALKAVIHGRYPTSQLRRLRREAELSYVVQSGHVCGAEYLGVERGTPFIVMERLHGETLRGRLADCGALSVSDALSIMMRE